MTVDVGKVIRILQPVRKNAMCVFVFTITDNLLINLRHVVFLDYTEQQKFLRVCSNSSVGLSLSNSREVSDNLRRYHDLPDIISVHTVNN